MTKGILVGLAATVPMTIAMRLLHDRLPNQKPAEDHEPLQPQMITHRMARLVGSGAKLHGKEWDAKTYAGHFGYGAGTGAIFTALSPKVPGSPVIKGMLYGLAVWTASYMGWLPAVGILPPATKQPKRRNAIMIAAHVVWGAALGLLQRR